MIKKFFLPLIIIVTVSCNIPTENFELKNGDIIFQDAQSSQSLAVRMATKSKYSHVGMIVIKGGKQYVYEAVQPVCIAPLQQWIDRGKDDHFVVKRLKNTSLLTPGNLKKMEVVGKQYNGKDYDSYFGWSDKLIYCSELVYKIYKEALNIEVGKLQKLSEFDLSHPAVQQKLNERYGNNIPMNEIVVSPQSIFESELLETVFEN